jgi:hypothetical protein
MAMELNEGMLSEELLVLVMVARSQATETKKIPPIYISSMS